MTECIGSDRRRIRLVEHREHRHDVLVLILTDKLGNRPDDIERPLRVRDAHHTVKEVDTPILAAVVVAVLTAGNGVKVEVDAETVLASPGDGFEEVGPRDAFEEGLVAPGFDGPPADGDANPV